MRKQFQTRGRLAIYFEHADIERMTAKARTEGKLLSEWARETLLGELATVEEMSRSKPVGVAGRGIVAPERPSEPATLSQVETTTRKRAACKHGTEKGWRCWQCGGLAVIDA